MPQFWVIGRIEDDNADGAGGRESAGVRRESIGPFEDYEDAKKAWAERAREAARQSRFGKSRFPGGRHARRPSDHAAEAQASAGNASAAHASGAGHSGPRTRYRIERIDPDEPPLCTD